MEAGGTKLWGKEGRGEAIFVEETAGVAEVRSREKALGMMKTHDYAVWPFPEEHRIGNNLPALQKIVCD